MKGIIIGIIAMLVITIINVVTILLKKKLMLNYSGLISLITNPITWLILFLSFCMMGANFLMLYFISVKVSAILSWSFVIPTFLITLLGGYLFFNETINRSQYIYIFSFIIMMIISVFLIWGFMKNG